MTPSTSHAQLAAKEQFDTSGGQLPKSMIDTSGGQSSQGDCGTRHDQKYPAGYLSISELINATGVTKATIHHYIARGLLPKAFKTAHNMAYYPPECIEIINAIRELRARHLPLAQVAEILSEHDLSKIYALLRLADEESLLLASYVNTTTPSKSREELLQLSGLAPEDLDYLEELGLARRENEDSYDGLTVELAKSLAAMRSGGMTEETGFHPRDIALYKRAIEQVVESEIAYFESRLLGKIAPEEIPSVMRAALEHAESICVLTRRRLLLDEIEKAASNRSHIKKTNQTSHRRQQ